MATLTSAPITQEVWAALDVLTDPEIPVVTLREMGILRDVRVEGNAVEVVITPTYSGCPAMEQIHDDIVSTVKALGVEVRVTTQLAPAWTTDWMTPQARDKLRAYGIAPPALCSHAAPSANGSSSIVLQFTSKAMARDVVPCPRCNSHDTTETSHFGSTACKSLYKCLSCMEPFDYFKPY
jgi:ring-1,2-phenylacetyl-CoA epoxidase subunit PaaD